MNNTIEKVQSNKKSQERTISILKSGNKRFVESKMDKTDYLRQVKVTASGQYPFAAVLGCIDSRVPAELIFDQGIGDLFNIRVAGNFVNDDILGNLEFACKVAGAEVIVVLGHTSCGAVKGACDNVQLGKLTGMLKNLQPAVDKAEGEYLDRTSENAWFVQAVADTNVELSIQSIKENSDVLREMIDNGDVVVVGAMYDIATGKVTFNN